MRTRNNKLKMVIYRLQERNRQIREKKREEKLPDAEEILREVEIE